MHDNNDMILLQVTGTVGTTSICQIDPIGALGLICQRYQCWLHVDAAYAGAALVCPENRSWLLGAEVRNLFLFCRK